MYISTYNSDIRKDADGKNSTYTILKVSFRFTKNEISRDLTRLREIKDRLNRNSRLIGYLMTKEKLKLTNHPHSSRFFESYDGRRTMAIYPLTLRLGFDVEIWANEKINQDEMLNIEGLHNFLLTGNFD